MNIIIPLGGKGDRFVSEGYTVPKPLIKINGRPLIYWVLDQFRGHSDISIWIPYRAELDAFNFQSMLPFEFPELNFNFIRLEQQTKDACETVMLTLDEMAKEQRGGGHVPTAVVDGDSYYPTPVFPTWKRRPISTVVFQEQRGTEPIFSFVNIERNNIYRENGLDYILDKVTDIKEKDRISKYYSTGFYGFTSPTALYRAIEDARENKIVTNGEVYISAAIKSLIKENYFVRGIQIYDHVILGTPEQIQQAKLPEVKRRYCFDLDNTLVTWVPKGINGKRDYSQVKPCEEAIKFAQHLKSKGHTIIIYTARNMVTCNHNTAQMAANNAKCIIETLERFNIPYDELCLGKPYADVYIDDAAVRPSEDVYKMTGVYDA